ncbi:MAG TPA: DUF5989 family protein [Polyangia bacterium]|jgi:hypothetical protein
MPPTRALTRLRLILRDAGELLGFVRRRRSLFLALLVGLLLAVALVLVLAQTAAVAPYVYPLF